MPSVQSDDGLSLAYRVVGEGRRAVVLVHGWMASGAIFDEMLAHLARDGRRFIVPDLRGAGASDKPAGGYTLERYARDVSAVAARESADQPYALVGHSMGGQIAQWIAAHEPARVAGLGLINTVPASGIPLPEQARGLFRESGGVRASQKAILDMACKQLPEASRERMLDDAGTIPAACIREAFDAWSAGGFANKLDAIRAPTLALATDDPFLPPDFLRQAVTGLIANSRLATLPGPGHYPHVERPRETAAVLEAFLAGLGY